RPVPSPPHTRRYLPRRGAHHRPHPLFSAHAEVFPEHAKKYLHDHALLRTRGGISRLELEHLPGGISPPHTRRYFPPGAGALTGGHLSSAHAEVFPLETAASMASMTLLRTRGGISKAHAVISASSDSSPHTRRYFPGQSG